MKTAHWLHFVYPLLVISCARFSPAPVVVVGEYAVVETPASDVQTVEELGCEAIVQAVLNRGGLSEYENAQSTASQRRRAAKNPAGDWEMRLRQDVDGPGPDDGDVILNRRATVRWTPVPIGLLESLEYREAQEYEARRHAMKETRATLAAEVRRDYLRIRSAQLAVDIATRQLTIDTAYRDLQRTALGVGAITGSQMEEALLEYRSSSDALELAKLDLKIRVQGFRRRYGYTPSNAACETSIEERPLAEHPQVQRRQAQANASHARAEWAEQRPEFEVSFLEVGYNRRESDDSDRILFELGIPLWNSSESDAQVARADALEDRVRVQWDALAVRDRVLKNQLRLKEEKAKLDFLKAQSIGNEVVPETGSPQLRIKRLRLKLKAFAQREKQALKVEAARIDLRESLGQP